MSEEQLKEFREHERTGRVLADDDFQKRLEKKLGRVLRRRKPGPKKVPKRYLCMLSTEFLPTRRGGHRTACPMAYQCPRSTRPHMQRFFWGY